MSELKKNKNKGGFHWRVTLKHLKTEITRIFLWKPSVLVKANNLFLTYERLSLQEKALLTCDLCFLYSAQIYYLQPYLTFTALNIIVNINQGSWAKAFCHGNHLKEKFLTRDKISVLRQAQNLHRCQKYY